MQDNREDGGPAFPLQTKELDGLYTKTKTYRGMSVRDWFAGQALVGLLSSSQIEPSSDDINEIVRLHANAAYAWADAMIAARKSGSG